MAGGRPAAPRECAVGCAHTEAALSGGPQARGGALSADRARAALQQAHAHKRSSTELCCGGAAASTLLAGAALALSLRSACGAARCTRAEAASSPASWPGAGLFARRAWGGRVCTAAAAGAARQVRLRGGSASAAVRLRGACAPGVRRPACVLRSVLSQVQ